MAVTVGGTSITFNDGTTQSTAAGAVTTTQVLNATASASVGAVGSYAFLAHASGGIVNIGSTIAGSSLRYSGGASAVLISTSENFSSITGTAPAGTWRCMGNVGRAAIYSSVVDFGTVFLRIS